MHQLTNATMGPISRTIKKDERRIAAALNVMFSKRALVAVTNLIVQHKQDPNFDLLGRILRLPDNRTFGLSEGAHACIREIARILWKSEVWANAVAYSDIYSAVVTMYKNALSADSRPDSAAELIGLLRAEIDVNIQQRSFVFPVFGVEPDEPSTSWVLGTSVIYRNLDHAIEETNCREEDHRTLLNGMAGRCWLVVTAYGTKRRSAEEAQRKAVHITNVLAVIAGTAFVLGASCFRIGVTFTPETSPGRAAWASWGTEKKLSVHLHFIRGQLLSINSELLNKCGGVELANRFFCLAEKESLSEVEQAMYRAAFWYGEAHRESGPTMQLVKYWSCVEAFFSLTDKEISEGVARGMAAILTSGPVVFHEVPSFQAIKREAKKLYDVRSQALHRAHHEVATPQDAARLSQLVAWMLINIVALIDLGYERLSDLIEECDRLANVESFIRS